MPRTATDRHRPTPCGPRGMLPRGCHHPGSSASASVEPRLGTGLMQVRSIVVVTDHAAAWLTCVAKASSNSTGVSFRVGSGDGCSCARSRQRSRSAAPNGAPLPLVQDVALKQSPAGDSGSDFLHAADAHPFQVLGLELDTSTALLGRRLVATLDVVVLRRLHVHRLGRGGRLTWGLAHDFTSHH